MLLNLSKGFDFSREDESYHVDYRFTREKQAPPLNGEDLFMILKVSVNHAAQKEFKILKPSSLLYKSNEEIESVIRAESFEKADSKHGDIL